MTRVKYADKLSEQEAGEFRGQVLEWYDQHRRDLPWRASPGMRMDPYKVWLSEIMLQQTTVGAVIPYYTKFLKKWPNVEALAYAAQEDVLNNWAGLGYYARARNLHKCAGVVANDFGGEFPEDQKTLQSLPGIGEYTSAAIRTIAFNKPASVMDGNIERIVARYFAVLEPLPKSKSILKSLTAELFEGFDDRPGDFAQALMDIGAGVCIAKTPRCGLCPLQKGCVGLKQQIAETLPRKDKKKPKPQKYGRVFWITDENDCVLLHRRPESGLLGGMAALPTTSWEEDKGMCKTEKVWTGEFRSLNAHIRHSFTHFDLSLELAHTSVKREELSEIKGYFWEARSDVAKTGFPTIFKKAVQVFLQS